MSPIKGRSAMIGATALAATAALGIPGVANAQSSDQPAQSEPARPGPGRHGPDLETAASVLGLSVDDLRTKLEGGQTLAAIAGEQNVDVQTLVDALVAEASDRLDEAVADGKLTADQAADRQADLPDRIDHFVNNTGPPGGPGGPGGRGGRGPSLEKAATALGLGADDLRSKLQGGQTLAQVAQAQGVDVQNGPPARPGSRSRPANGAVAGIPASRRPRRRQRG